MGGKTRAGPRPLGREATLSFQGGEGQQWLPLGPRDLPYRFAQEKIKINKGNTYFEPERSKSGKPLGRFFNRRAGLVRGHTLSRHGPPTLPKIAGTRFVSPFQDGRRAVPASDRGIRTNCAHVGPPGRPKLAAGLGFPSVLHNWPTPGGGGSRGHPKQKQKHCVFTVTCIFMPGATTHRQKQYLYEGELYHCGCNSHLYGPKDGSYGRNGSFIKTGLRGGRNTTVSVSVSGGLSSHLPPAWASCVKHWGSPGPRQA